MALIEKIDLRMVDLVPKVKRTDAIQSCDTEVAPWHVVPADRKWYRNWAITMLMI